MSQHWCTHYTHKLANNRCFKKTFFLFPCALARARQSRFPWCARINVNSVAVLTASHYKQPHIPLALHTVFCKVDVAGPVGLECGFCWQQQKLRSGRPKVGAQKRSGGTPRLGATHAILHLRAQRARAFQIFWGAMELCGDARAHTTLYWRPQRQDGIDGALRAYEAAVGKSPTTDPHQFGHPCTRF